MTTVKLKGVEDDNFVNYKYPVMFLATTSCTFKCDKECGKNYCINSSLVNQPNIKVGTDYLIKRYIDNPITKAIVIGGLEPFDTFDDLLNIVHDFREAGVHDDIVIYTGYYLEEIEDKIKQLMDYDNIIVKYGRYKHDQPERYDEVLGVKLASNNQYAEKIS